MASESAAGVEAVESTAAPLNATEALTLVSMGAKEIVDVFGEDRIRATLTAFNDAEIDLTKSARQLANILKKRLSE